MQLIKLDFGATQLFQLQPFEKQSLIARYLLTRSDVWSCLQKKLSYISSTRYLHNNFQTGNFQAHR